MSSKDTTPFPDKWGDYEEIFVTCPRCDKSRSIKVKKKPRERFPKKLCPECKKRHPLDLAIEEIEKREKDFSRIYGQPSISLTGWNWQQVLKALKEQRERSKMEEDESEQ